MGATPWRFKSSRPHLKKVIDTNNWMCYYGKVAFKQLVDYSNKHLFNQREVAQLGRALGLGPRGRRFKSCLPDLINNFGALAQLGERLPCKQEVGGSTPLGSTIIIIQNWGGVAQLARAYGSYP